MSNPAGAKYTYLSWVRQGAASGIITKDRSLNQAGVVSISVQLNINNVHDDAHDIKRQVRLYGPGDIVGIDQRQVVRTEPRHLSTEFEPNYFPAIEFDRPDFPWLFTPAKADDTGILRPWLCLVVVRKQPGIEIRADRNSPLPFLEIISPARPWQELPNLAESWAWAHAQVIRESNVDLRDSLAGNPVLTVSRILCPRRLDPDTEYIACLVPAFELGRKAGRGLPITPTDEKKLEPAWVLGEESPTEVSLPVYFHWEFRTGSGGDFEKLVRLLEPRKMSEEVGKLQVNISNPGFLIAPILPEGTIIEMQTALRVPDSETAPWSQNTRKPFQENLREILNAPWQALKQNVNEPLLAPPIYGCWQAAEHTVEITPNQEAARWLHDLNLDPRHRAAAALGTQTIQNQQEQLMVSAWEQLGDIERINRLRRQAQLARAVNNVYYAKHFSGFPAEILLKVTATAQARILVKETDTKQRALLTQRISQSALPDRTVSAPLRRLTSTRGVISSRFQTIAKRPIDMVKLLNNKIPIVPAQKGKAGVVTVDEILIQQGEAKPTFRFDKAVVALDSLISMPSFRVNAADKTTLLSSLPEAASVPDPSTTDNAPTQAFRKAAIALHHYLNHKLFMTIWRNHKFVFHAGPGSLYGVDHLGRLVFFRHDLQDRMAEVDVPTVIGKGGWLQFKFLFSAGNNIIYAVNQNAELLRYEDKFQQGGGFVKNPTPIGSGVWLQHRFLFSGGDNIIYAVNQSGQLLRYEDKSQRGGGAVDNPSIISPSGWMSHQFVFSGGEGKIYAVDSEGKLLFFEDQTQNGSNTVTGPSVLSSSGWNQHKHVFAGENGIIYAVDSSGRLLISQHEIRDGKGAVEDPSPIGLNETVSPPTLDLLIMKEAVLKSVNPERTIKARVDASLVLADGRSRIDDPLEPIKDEPQFPQPMYEALRDLSQDYLFPGLDQVPPNTITVLQTNSEFIESFLVGLNNEMGHEMLWRGFPLKDQRGTYFQQFWDTSAGSGAADIDPIKDWGKRSLGTNIRTGDILVLLLRGELLRRYPNSVIYAVKAVKINGQLDLSLDPQDELHPIFRGTLDPDVTFLGFGLTSEKALANDGYFFVIQQQPTEPRFGMDDANFTKPSPPDLASWNDLSWHHFAQTENDLKALSHVPLTPVPEKIAKLSNSDQAKWNKNAAHQAFITLQRPVRIAIHAREMIP